MSLQAAAPPTDDMSPEDFAIRLHHALMHGETLGYLHGLDEHDHETLYAVALEFYNQARYDEALTLFRFLMTLNHLEERYIGAYAACLQMHKEYEQALVYYSMASVFDLSDPKPTFHTCECLIALGRIDEAHEGLGMVIEQCVEPHHEALARRAQALRDLIEQQAKSVKQGVS